MKKLFIFSLVLCLQHNPLAAMKRLRTDSDQETQLLIQHREERIPLNSSSFDQATSSSLLTPPQEKNKLQCGNCDRLFKAIQGLRKHELTCEQKTREMESAKKASQEMLLQKKRITKITTQPNVDKNKICPTCGTGFETNYGLNNHIMLHTGERPYQCHLCAQGFIQKCNLKKHLKNCAEKSKLKNTNVTQDTLNEIDLDNRDLSDWLDLIQCS